MFKIESNILLSSILHEADLLLEDELLEFMYIVHCVVCRIVDVIELFQLYYLIPRKEIEYWRIILTKI